MTNSNQIKIIIGNTYSKLHIDQGLEFYYYPMLAEIDDALSFPVQGREYMDLYNRFTTTGQRVWDGKKHLINLTGSPLKKVAWKQYVTEPNLFLTGNLFRILEVLHKFGVEPHLEVSPDKQENSLKPINKFEYLWDKSIQIRDYQQECINIAVKNKRGLLQIATGGGKTIIAANIIKSVGIQPVLFLVTTKDLLYQAYGVFKQTLLMPNDVGLIGDGKCEIGKVNVSTIQTIIRAIGSTEQYNQSIKELSQFMEDAFESSDKSEVEQNSVQQIKNLLSETRMVIFDECQHSPAETCRLAITQCNQANYRYGLSATPFREDGEDLTIEGLFGRKLINITSTYLIENNYLVKPSITMVDLRPDHGKKLAYAEEYKVNVVENPIRNKIITSYAEHFKSRDFSVLILVRQIKHGTILEKLIKDSVFIHGTKSSKKRSESLEGLRNKDIQILIATSLADEGVDIPNLDALILAGSGKSKVRALQRIGRVIRKADGKHEAYVVDFIDSGQHCRRHSLARKKIYETEEAFKGMQIIRIDELAPDVRNFKSKGDLV